MICLLRRPLSLKRPLKVSFRRTSAQYSMTSRLRDPDVKSCVVDADTAGKPEVTKMVRRYGRSPCGRLLVASVPHGHWKTLTFIAALRFDGMTAPYVIDGAMDRPTFIAYVEQVLAPTLKKGDIILMDNLRTHKVDGVRQAIEAVGASERYRPAYSPDLNPIEQAFSKLKTAMRKGAARTVTVLWKLIGRLIKTFAPEQCVNYFRHAGYGR
jgi:transposase